MRFCLALLCCCCRLLAQDSDRDGLSDALEDTLLAQFAPNFLISATDCDQRPATFLAGQASPRAVSRDGRIYGQVFPTAGLAGRGAPGPYVEIHYYHLWSRDCGRTGHPLDAEHVSVLLRSSDWRALYWYAAAHQGTLCDASQAAPASVLQAETTGATIWISAGKHASFLSAEACRGGCGGDRCEQMADLPRMAVVNIGERDAPMNGALWTTAVEWPLAAKMSTDFPPGVMAQIDAAGGIVPVNRPPGPIQSVVAYSSDPLDAAVIGRDQTRSALVTAHESVNRSLRQAEQATRKWLQRILY